MNVDVINRLPGRNADINAYVVAGGGVPRFDGLLHGGEQRPQRALFIDRQLEQVCGMTLRNDQRVAGAYGVPVEERDCVVVRG